MDVQALNIEGAYLFTPKQFADSRGAFMEIFKGNVFSEHLGHDLSLAQANCSISSTGVVRGIHFADVPPSQAKYVTCMRGTIFDVVIDIRVGSPTFGQWHGEILDDKDHRALYISEGLGHAFMALSEDTTVMYLCSEPYAPEREHGIHPLDPQIGIIWPDDVAPALSDKDSVAPTLAEMEAAGRLPTWEAATQLRESLRGDPQ